MHKPDRTAEIASVACISRFDGLWCVPASPYHSMDGALVEAMGSVRLVRGTRIAFAYGVEQALEGYHFQPERAEEKQAMSDPAHTVRLHRVLRAAPERVYRAFLDPDAMVKWLPPHGFTGKIQHMDARVDGGYRMSFTNFGTGRSHSFGGKYIELTPHERIRYSDRFDDPDMPGEMQVTIVLHKVGCGTDITIVQEGLPPMIPVEFCYLGWQESLSLLAHLVEPEIPDGA